MEESDKKNPGELNIHERLARFVSWENKAIKRIELARKQMSPVQPC